MKAHDRTVNYAWCDANCTIGTSWAGYVMPFDLDTGKDGLALAHDADGRPVIAVEKPNSDLLVATCTGSCESTSANWIGQTVDSSDLLAAATNAPQPTCDPGYAPAAFWYPGDSVRLAFDAAGNPRLAYEAYVLQKCGGGNPAEAVRLTRYAQIPRQQ